MKHIYRTGKEARESFERTMRALFRVPKAIAKKPEKPALKTKREGGN
jgi:hypothetical protein